MEFKKGMLVKVIGNCNSHGYEIGKIYKIHSPHGCGEPECYILAEKNGRPGSTVISIKDMEAVGLTKADFEKERDELDKKIAEIDNKIEWMTKNKVEKFDETEYKCWAALKTLDSKVSMMDKAKIIAKLIKGE